MANKRMFTIKIVDSDAFLNMPLSAQALYFHLNMRADDDGFIGNPQRIMRMIGVSEDDYKLLIAKSFLILFDNGVIVIKHWRMHNTLSKGRYKETAYVSEKDMLRIKRNGAYSLTEGDEIDDTQLVESGKRQVEKELGIEAEDNRRTKDEQKTNTDIDIDIDKDLDLGLGLEKVNLKEDKSSLSLNGRGKAELYQEIVDHWNSLPSNITKVSKISERGTRKNLLDARIKEYGIDQIHAAIEEIPKSEFLMGYGNRGWTIKFDWFIKPSNFVKVLEGNYRGKVRLSSGNAYIDAVQHRNDHVITFGQEEE